MNACGCPPWLAFVILTVVPLGCSRPNGFYAIPEHQDLGVINNGERTVDAEFEIFNGLREPVEIEHTYPSCSCTTVQLRNNPIPPGESTILRVTARLSKQPGRKDFSVVLLTNNQRFPKKRLSFSALIPARGTRKRQLFLGNFYQNDRINYVLPASSFTQGNIAIVENSAGGDSLDLTTRLTTVGRNGELSLITEGPVPNIAGPFSKKIYFREYMPKETGLGEGMIELELTGNVVARWEVKPELYLGFLSSESGTITLDFKSNAGSKSDDKKTIPMLTATLDEEWLLVKGQSISPDKIEIKLKLERQALSHFGANQNKINLRIDYDDGSTECYPSTLFAYIQE